LPLEETKQQVANSRLIKIAVDKSIALNPTNDLSWQVLGRWYRGVADVSPLKRAFGQIKYGKLPSAKYEDAVCCFEKAIELNPNRLMHCIDSVAPTRKWAKMRRRERSSPRGSRWRTRRKTIRKSRMSDGRF
jgi:hypothetical protein